MSERVVHRLTGYDKRTELLAVEPKVPPDDVARAKQIAGVGRDDPDAIGSNPLDP